MVMADVESRSQSNGAPEAAANRTRARTESAADAAQDTVKAEQRSFAGAAQSARAVGEQAAEHARAAAQTGLKTGQDLAAAGQEAMRKASGQAVDLWRSSLDPLANMQNELGRWFEQAWRQGLSGRLQTAPLFGEAVFAALSGAPTADLYETPEGLELMVELPGMTAEDVQLSLKGDILIVAGERESATTREEGSYRVRERRLGSFQRSFVLPAGVDHAGIQARFDKGVLTVTIPRSGAAGPESRSIRIKG
jgi:HSP20 family protein